MSEQSDERTAGRRQWHVSRRRFLGGLGVAAAVPVGAALLSSCAIGGGNDTSNGNAGAGLSDSAQKLIADRKLTPDDVTAALKTYMPSGQMDDYVMFASSGHAGQIFVISLPSMRVLKTIGVYTPEPWQGYGFSDETKAVLEGGYVNGKPILYGDTHHPALSETNGEYDGQFLFINEKANGRLAVIDLRDFATKQIIKNPLLINEHGGAFVTPNTDYILEADQYPTPLGWEYAPLSQFKEKYRGLICLWKFDRQKGRIIPEESFGIETPPYDHDLADAGKGVSDGWAFWNSFNTEMAFGQAGDKDKPFLEIGASQRDMDYLHVINYRKAAEVVKAGKAEKMKGRSGQIKEFDVIRMQTAIDEGILFLVPEPKSPHGVDVTPNGEYLVVAGKLDPHVTVYSFQKIQDAIKKGTTEKDEYGVPVLGFQDCMETQVELGLGPLHTQYDDQGYAYTSLFLDSAVARWSLGKPYRDDGWKLVEKIPVHYNVGHIAAAEGDTAKPAGNYLVALNKWSVDRFPVVGPLLPQNLQLMDISKDNKFRVLSDMPLGFGEPHYAQIMKRERLKALEVYPEVGWNPITWSKDPHATAPGQERIERNGTKVEIWMSLMRSRLNPDTIEVNEGDEVVWHLTNIEKATDATHGFALGGQNINLSLEPGKTETITFKADMSGTFPFYCTEFCSALHLEMAGYFLVKPKGA
jgi:nitrous-oxide reductase